ncbi:hypothetical protein [Micromonospora sp. NPDC005305]|uniref:DUF7662 domain-containing protein n=1 Tax=Micromonospora sp. NPDC005305 TaxID=3156875 RepID=UPI0033A807E6
MRAGEPEFEQAVEVSVAILREAARDSRDDSDALVTYRQLSDLLAQHGLQVPYHGRPMPYILEEASLREHAANRGMVSALVVKQGRDGKPTTPSGGFYRMARRRPFVRRGANDGISELVPGGLPPSTYRHEAWWANGDRSHSHSRAWGDAGFTAHPELARRAVRFVPQHGVSW